MAVLARVVLHERTGESQIPIDNYNLLHENMERIGFSKNIRNPHNGKYYELPPATYVNYNSIESAMAVQAVKQAANYVRKENSVLVVPFVLTQAMWLDLKEVK